MASQIILDRNALSERRASLQRIHRRTFLVGLGLAVAVHAWLLLSNPRIESESEAAGGLAPLDLSLLTPKDVLVDGRLLPAGTDWPALLVNYGNAEATLNVIWPPAYRRAREGGSVALKLELGPDGVVRHAEVVEGSGDMLKDKVLVELAGHFTFRLDMGDLSPSEVTLVQPIRVSPRE